MTETILPLLLFICFAAFAAKRCMTYLHIYQQEEYDTPRFLRWMLSTRSFDKRVSFALVLICGLSFFIPMFFTQVLLVAIFALAGYLEPDPRSKAKKPLNLTKRAQRILIPAIMMAVILGVWVFLLPQLVWLWLINVHIIPILLVVTNDVQQPYESYIQNKLLEEARAKVRAQKPYIIGITGSFGKTSVKHILGHILKMKAPTLMTPGSVNTPMGITRIIREQLSGEHKYFIVEMGAYGPGSIERLCNLTPPDLGIITSIGHAHYERFKSLDTVARAKYELAESVLRKDDGLMIVGERTLRFENAQNIRAENIHQFIVCGEKQPEGKEGGESHLMPGDVEILAIDQKIKGLEIAFQWKKNKYVVSAPIFGLHHGYNIVLAFIAALELKMSAEDIQTALSTLPQIAHRLEVKPQADGTIVIDDAYNANPLGFTSALELLDMFGRKTKGRKILITPGMVELGSAHEEAHAKIGAKAAMIADIVIAVCGERIPSFVQAVKAGAPGKQLIEVSSFAEAQRWVNDNRQPKDIILIENDLPDLYERKLKI